MRVALIALALVALAGCGFKPMYAPSANGGGALIGPVNVGEVPGKAGHAFRTELTRQLEAERTGAAPRQLQITVSESVSPLGLRVDESATRADFLMAASYKLFEVNGDELVRGNAAVTVSYDIPVAAYAANAAQDDARERAGVMLADRVRTDLALRLTRLRNAPPKPAEAAPADPALVLVPPASQLSPPVQVDQPLITKPTVNQQPTTP